MMSDTGSSDYLTVLPASYRDPSGFVFRYQKEIYRQVNPVYREYYDQLMSSGLYDKLVSKKRLIEHHEVSPVTFESTGYYKIIKPRNIPFISYPWEWPFAMLKDAALLTLKIMHTAIEHGMILKDATPYNIQWLDDRLVFIDTLSFEKYEAGSPWIAYRQFCEQFLCPLLLMHYKKMPLQPLSLAYPEGIPLEITSSLLPRKSRFSIYAWLHIHLHARYAKKNRGKNEQGTHLPKKKLLNLVSSLESLVNTLKLPLQDTTWGDYYNEAGTRNDYLDQKKKIISGWLDKLESIHTATDFGANDGTYSLLTAEKNIETLAMDADIAAVTKLYNSIAAGQKYHIQPLLADLSNPSPAIGVNNLERDSLTDRLRNRDLGLALALLHHLCLGKNIPFEAVAELFAGSCRKLVIEFVPKTDPKSQQILLNKKDIYSWYTAENFELAFNRHFRIIETVAIPGTERVLYLMERAS